MKNKEEYIVFIGSPCIDEYYKITDDWPRMGDKGNAVFLGNVPGGMIANAACVCAGYGVKTYCFDVMSSSKSAQFLIEDMENNHVDMSRVVRRDDFADSKCIIFQKGGERSIIVVKGSAWNHKITKDEREFLRSASYMLTTLPNLNKFHDPEGMLKDMRGAGVKIVFDNEATTYKSDFESFFQYAHTLFFNEFSIKVFSNQMAEEEFFKKMFAMGVQNIVITLGPLGCRVITADEDFYIPSYDVPKVDTTGAGDTFNSTFTVGMLRGWGIKETAFFANAAANMSIGVQGPRGGITSEEKVRQFILERSQEILPIY